MSYLAYEALWAMCDPLDSLRTRQSQVRGVYFGLRASMLIFEYSADYAGHCGLRPKVGHFSFMTNLHADHRTVWLRGQQIQQD